ncbi:hypothetical protein FGG33_gp15 [Mycobacterium phage Benedict]|uniref:Uncharacterized protein n=2 Tax=Benedictvirus TaxID=2946819 RepID=G1EDM9_9CAUD|nr:hypothetical protein AVV06_gp11 [Mycobacterium phage Chadwick]YP_009637985.1 hypothetical protein FGG33_gp15 [Mycobacterium phage Benedict]AEJ93435.1 hypothetical protein BENEDICT_82 [Mycobacterium phage Benedict]ALA06811.1 hypothetical protein SEA_CHADWICK_84 [Mycobacterium phage Chadwick]
MYEVWVIDRYGEARFYAQDQDEQQAHKLADQLRPLTASGKVWVEKA